MGSATPFGQRLHYRGCVGGRLLGSSRRHGEPRECQPPSSSDERSGLKQHDNFMQHSDLIH